MDVFFILSGFVIFYTTKDGSCWKCFALKCVFRIFPLYLFCLFIYYEFYHQTQELELSFLEWIQNIIMTPFSDAIGYHSLVVGQAWSTCYELYFYTMLCIILVMKVNIRVLLLVLLFFLTLGMALSWSEIGNRYGFIRYVVSLIGARHIVMFLIGIILSLYYKKLPPHRAQMEYIELKNQYYSLVYR